MSNERKPKHDRIVRRPYLLEYGDNIEIDIEFIGEKTLDVDALCDFVGSDDADIRKFYDQRSPVDVRRMRT